MEAHEALFIERSELRTCADRRVRAENVCKCTTRYSCAWSIAKKWMAHREKLEFDRLREVDMNNSLALGLIDVYAWNWAQVDVIPTCSRL